MKTSKYICDNCGKGIQHANLVSHAKNRTHTVRKPNIHAATLLVDNVAMKMRLCTKCLRMSKKLGLKVGGATPLVSQTGGQVKKEAVVAVTA